MARFSECSSYIRRILNHASSPAERKKLRKMTSTPKGRYDVEYGLLEEIEEVAP